MQRSIPCLFMRGGTSRGPFFAESDLPVDVAERDRVLLAAMGSPDSRQIDGIGGADPLTSKVGWADDGTLVLHEKVANGQTTDVSEADAKAMLAHANAALDVAQGHAPKLNTGAQADKKDAKKDTKKKGH